MGNMGNSLLNDIIKIVGMILIIIGVSFSVCVDY